MKFADAWMVHGTGARGTKADIGVRPQGAESFTAPTEFIDRGIQKRVICFTAGDLPSTSNDTRGGVIPVDV